MKKLSTTLLLMVLTIPMFAGVQLLYGSLSEADDANEILVKVDWSKTVYSKSGTLQDFLREADRNPAWEEESLDFMLEELNKKTEKYGVHFVRQSKKSGNKYTLEILPSKISKGGDLEGIIVLKKKGENLPIAQISFVSDDSDDDDEIAFKDQFESIGESLAKLFVKELKKSRR